MSLSVICVVSAPANITRGLSILFSGRYHNSKFAISIGLQIASAALIGIISLINSIKYGKRITREETLTPNERADSTVNRYLLSIAMIIMGGILFGLGVILLQKQWHDYSIISIHFQGVIVSSITVLLSLICFLYISLKLLLIVLLLTYYDLKFYS